MQLEKVVKKEKPAYPSFNDHRLKRRGALKLMFGGVIAAFAAGCNFLANRTSGVMAVPDHPNAQPDKPGEDLPLGQPAQVDGGMVLADPPEPPVERGNIRQPEPPRIKGKMAPVKPPIK